MESKCRLHKQSWNLPLESAFDHDEEVRESDSVKPIKSRPIRVSKRFKGTKLLFSSEPSEERLT